MQLFQENNSLEISQSSKFILPAFFLLGTSSAYSAQVFRAKLISSFPEHHQKQ